VNALSILLPIQNVKGVGPKKAKLLQKLNLKCEKLLLKDIVFFERNFRDILEFQNNDQLVINYNQLILLIGRFHNQFKNNIIYTHYNYALEWNVMIISENYIDANDLIEEVEGTLDILKGEFLILTLHHLANYYTHINKYIIAEKYYLLCIENMVKYKVSNQLIYVDMAYNFMKKNQNMRALSVLSKALIVFRNTNNPIILERIYRYYSIIYLKEGYYDECKKFLTKATKLIINSNRLELKNQLLNIEAVMMYIKNDKLESQRLLNAAKNIHPSETTVLLEMINNCAFPQELKFNTVIYNQIKQFYGAIDEKENYYEDHIRKIENDIPIEINIVIFRDYYHYLKDNKKYKKAIECLEYFKFNNEY